jgi:hypothetical protein
MPHTMAVLVRVLFAVAVAFVPLSMLGGPFLFGLALKTVRATPRRGRVEIAGLDVLPCAVGVGAALAGSYLALPLGAAGAGALLLAMLALASAFRWRVRSTGTATEVARTFLGVPWRRRVYHGRARLEETGWGDASDPAAIEVLVGTESVCELCWILRNQGEQATRVLDRANGLLAAMQSGDR